MRGLAVSGRRSRESSTDGSYSLVTGRAWSVETAAAWTGPFLVCVRRTVSGWRSSESCQGWSRFMGGRAVLGGGCVSRAVLVTGGSRGIGSAVARAFAERGDRVAVHYRGAASAAETVRDSLHGDGHVVVQADLTSAAEVAAMVDAAAAGLDG